MSITATTTAQPDASGQRKTAGPGVRGRVALVTGGTRGIGAAICHELAGGGAEIAAGYWRGHEGAEKFAASMAADYPGQRITAPRGNIGEPDDCRRVAARGHRASTAGWTSW
jgi:NAD(P)-dependent dehydrogenase (short-subunit alcohol dehydrogenase family)